MLDCQSLILELYHELRYVFCDKYTVYIDGSFNTKYYLLH